MRDDKLTVWAINSTRRQLCRWGGDRGRGAPCPTVTLRPTSVIRQIGKWSLMKFRFLIHFCTAQAHMTIKCFLSIVSVAEVSSSPVSNNDVLLITRCGQWGLARSPSHRGVRGRFTATLFWSAHDDWKTLPHQHLITPTLLIALPVCVAEETGRQSEPNHSHSL